MSKKVTCETVAAAAGVSRSTVSLIMNGHNERVSDETRKRVLKIVDELGYRPNLSARTIRTQKSKAIGIIVEGIAEGWFAQLLFGAEKKLREMGYQVILSSLYYQKGFEQDLTQSIELLLSRQVDGIIIITSNETRSIKPLQSILNLKIPLVLVDFYSTEEIQVPRIYLNYEEAGMIAIEHLYRLGKRRIALIGTVGSKSIVSEDNSANMFKEVYRGYKNGLAKFKLPLVPEFVKIKNSKISSSPCERLDFSKGRLRFELGKIAMEELLSLAELPDAVYCVNDYVAYGVIACLAEREIKIPEQIAVMGNNNIHYSEFTNPGLTSVEMHLTECGHLAAEILLKLFEGKNVELKSQGPVSLVVRSST